MEQGILWMFVCRIAFRVVGGVGNYPRGIKSYDAKLWKGFLDTALYDSNFNFLKSQDILHFLRNAKGFDWSQMLLRSGCILDMSSVIQFVKIRANSWLKEL